MTGQVPASEIIREAEQKLAQAYSMRQNAYDLLREAASIEAAVQEYAISVMGPDKGLIAFEMAKWSLNGDGGEISIPQSSPQKIDVPVEPIKSPEPVSAPVKTVATRAVSNVTTLSSRSLDKDKYFGENVPSARTAEADEIVAQATSYVAQGRKGNPYGSDRGKNAWRKSLFNSAYSHLSAALPVLTEEHGNVVDAENKVVSIVVSDVISTEDQTRKTVAVDHVAAELAELVEESASDSDETVDDVSETIFEDILETEYEEDAVNHSHEVLDEEARHDFDVVDDNLVDVTKDGVADPEGEITAADIGEHETNDAAAEDKSSALINEQEASKEATFVDKRTDAGVENNIKEKPPLDGVVDFSPSSDPFDDMDELPPANTAPPPRGFGAKAVGSFGFSAKPAAVEAKTSEVEKKADVVVAATTKPVGFQRPSFASVKPVQEASVVADDEAKQDTPVDKTANTSVSVKPSGFSSPTSLKAHTPMPIPAHRRPGNGQTLQQPMTLTSAVVNAQSASSAEKPKVNNVSTPPSFLNRKV